MLFSQIALLVLIVMGIVTGYLPLWLGLATLAAWGGAKLAMRPIVARIERDELASKRRAGARIDIHNVKPIESLEDAAGDSYDVDLTIHPDRHAATWEPNQVTVFQDVAGHTVPCDVQACLVWRGEEFVPCGVETQTGTARLRIRVAVSSREAALQIRCHDERLGTVPLPK